MNMSNISRGRKPKSNLRHHSAGLLQPRRGTESATVRSAHADPVVAQQMIVHARGHKRLGPRARAAQATDGQMACITLYVNTTRLTLRAHQRAACIDESLLRVEEHRALCADRQTLLRARH